MNPSLRGRIVSDATNAVADWGNWRDQPWQPPKPTMVGGHVVGAPAKSNMDAARDALKRDLARGAKRVGT